MSSNLSPSLIKAILSMDSYNRGYDAGIQFHEADETVDKRLGNFKIVAHSSDLTNDLNETNIDVPIGFYALAYEYAGETIISYRGTNYPNSDNPFVRFADILHGWPMGAGDINTEQGLMALEFYQEVVGAGNDPRSGDVKMVGHSLGGGLAGYVGANDNYNLCLRLCG